MKESRCLYIAVLFLLLVNSSHQVWGFITCYCNLPQCQSEDNTCTALDRCYSKFYMHSTSNNDTEEKDEFGCVDLLPVQESDADGPVCDGDEGTAVKRTSTGYPLLYCCSGNMCNSKDERDLSVDIAAPANRGDGQLNGRDVLVVEEANGPVRPRSSTTSSEDAIFRAAVVAVPIAGSLILIVLIVMAVKMLKDDQRNASTHHGSFFKTNRFIQKHFALNKKAHKPCIKTPVTAPGVKSGRSDGNQQDEESLQPLRGDSNIVSQSNVARHPRLCHSLSVV